MVITILLVVLLALFLQTLLVWGLGSLILVAFGVTYNFTFWQAFLVSLVLGLISGGSGASIKRGRN